MKKIFKWIGIVFGAIIGILIIVIAGLVIYSNIKFKPSYSDRPLYQINADTSPENIARGRYLMEDAMLCTEACHSEFGMELAGGADEISEGPVRFVFAVPNLTPDQETGLGSWSDAEIARAIREGIDKDGVGLIGMPSYSYHALSDTDVSAVVSYLRNIEPIKNEIPPIEGNAIAKIMLALGLFGPDPVGEPIISEQVNPKQGSIENGKYMVAIGECMGCHKQDLAGGPLPMAAPDDTPAANLTPGGELAFWSATDFIKAVKTGMHPGGRILDAGMPRYRMTDEDLMDIFSYLQTLPASR